jgi:hypothetical protein
MSRRSSVIHFCILDRLDLFFYLPSHPIHLPSFCSAQGWCWCLLFVSCLTAAASTSRYQSCMFICSYLVFLLVRIIHICAWPNTFGEVWFISNYACSFLGVRIDFFISKHLDSVLLTFACFYPSLIPHDLAWFTICTLTSCS